MCLYDRSVWPWWWHQMEKNAASLDICEGNPPVADGFPSQRPVSFDVFFDLRLNKRLNRQSKNRWFEKLSRSLRRRHNDIQNDQNVFLLVHIWLTYETFPYSFTGGLPSRRTSNAEKVSMSWCHDRIKVGSTWLRHDKEMFVVLLGIGHFWGNQPVTIGFPPKSLGILGICSFCFVSLNMLFKLPLVWDTMVLTWRHSNHWAYHFSWIAPVMVSVKWP